MNCRTCTEEKQVFSMWAMPCAGPSCRHEADCMPGPTAGHRISQSCVARCRSSDSADKGKFNLNPLTAADPTLQPATTCCRGGVGFRSFPSACCFLRHLNPRFVWTHGKAKAEESMSKASKQEPFSASSVAVAVECCAIAGGLIVLPCLLPSRPSVLLMSQLQSS